MTKQISRRPRAAGVGLKAIALMGAMLASGHAFAQTPIRAEPFPAWPDPVITPTLSVAGW